MINMKRISISAFLLLFSALWLNSCQKQEPEQHLISVDAGASQSIQLPSSTATLNGTVIEGQTNNTSYLWTMVSGPNTPSFINHNTLHATVNGLIEGTYVFQFQATNNFGVTGYDTTSVIVTPNAIHTATLQPSNNSYEGILNLFYPTSWAGNHPEVVMAAWTSGGSPFTARACIRFDYSGIPGGTVIDNAQLYLFADHTPNNGNQIDAHSGTANACYIQRILSNWVLPDPFTWNNPPAITTTNQAVIPQSTSSFEDRVIDVTALVKDMMTNGNNGFMIRLQNEVIYNCQQYCSSFDADATKRPKLVITYH